jgi:signal transduction histidine kinase
LVEQAGKETLSLPLLPRRSIQVENNHNKHLFAVIVPMIDSDTNQPIGYVRVSESMQEFDQIVRNLDLGLGGGIVIALLLSGIGGSWLTRQAMQPIEQSFQRLQQFTADASHELRNPLMAIKSNAAVALRYPEGMRALDAEKFEAIANATNQMTHLTEDLLFLARYDQMPQRDWKPINLTMLLNDLIQLYQPQAIAKSLCLKANLRHTSQILGDSAQLSRLFTNLIDNAIHYTPIGGTIEIRSSQISTYIQVSVEDTGTGIAAEHLKHLFDRFWRADHSRTQWEGGAGLGLSIAQNIAQAHGGKISVTSQLGQGSCFTVRLLGIA